MSENDNESAYGESAAETTSVFRRLAQICVMATVALTLLMSVVLLPQLQSEVAYNGTYVDVLADQHANDYADIIPVGDSG